MRVIDHVIQSIRDVAIYNPEIQVAPSCILWPDGDKQWKMAIPKLIEELPELLILGDYNPTKRTGPAIWLRCVLSKMIDDIELPKNRIPVLYLPEISRQDLRRVETCPEYLKPIVELQYRGSIWSQPNTKDWTIMAFLKSQNGGLGLDVAQDSKTKDSMIAALDLLLYEDVEKLKGKHLDKEFFDTLVTGGDPIRDFLYWLDQGDSYRQKLSEKEWKAFIDICKSKLGFNPEKEGVLTAAAKLASREDIWFSVWERFCEAPKRYPKIPERLRQSNMPPEELFSDEKTHGSWPQWNETQENILRKELISLEKLPTHEARNKVIELEEKHGERRCLVWADLGESQLALSLKHLTKIASLIKNSLTAGSIDQLKNEYCAWGWKVDDTLLKALYYGNKMDDFEAIKTAVRALYITWAEKNAKYFQEEVENSGYPRASIREETKPIYKKKESILFIDGLRFDIAKRLVNRLEKKGYKIETKSMWAALPSITATGKPAVSPIRDKIIGEKIDPDFEPIVSETGKSLKGGYHFRKLLIDSGWSVNGNDSWQESHAWIEGCSIDHEGHNKGWKLVRQIDEMLDEIEEQIKKLNSHGCENIRIVTDHGWLLVPGGLPKIDMPKVLTVNKWGRCAVLKEGAKFEAKQYPWYWNPTQYFVSAEGIHCFEKNNEYAHGGLSLQECLIPEIMITSGVTRKSLEFKDISWKRLRCVVKVEGNTTGIKVDIRKQAGDPSSTVVVKKKELDENGEASILVENEELEQKNAYIVLIDENNEIKIQSMTVIGGGEND